MIQVLYSSVAKVSIDEDEIKSILERAKQSNATLKITGLLLYRDGHFLQLLEGERSAVHAVLNRIKNDPRHGNVKILIDAPTAKRLFPEWNMGYIDEPVVSTTLNQLLQPKSGVPLKAEQTAIILQTIRNFALLEKKSS